MSAAYGVVGEIRRRYRQAGGLFLRNVVLMFIVGLTASTLCCNELGFAFAYQKDVILVCCDERSSKYPFDIQRSQIVNYKASSKSDFEKLEILLLKKFTAPLHKSKT